MTTLGETLTGLARLTLEDPRRAARKLLGMGVPLPARTAGLLLMAVASALLMQVGFLLLPPVGDPPVVDPISAYMVASPIRTAVIQWLILVASVLLIHQIGRALGGRGSLSDTLLIVVWLQVIMLGVQGVQLLALVLSPPLAGLVNLAGMVLFFWLFSSFIAELHGFASRLRVFLGILAASLAIALAIVVILSAILGPEALQNV
jgi:hypothetical protein